MTNAIQVKMKRKGEMREKRRTENGREAKELG